MMQQNGLVRLRSENMATVGGNICRSSPSSDMVVALMALDAMLKLIGPKGERTVSIEKFTMGSGENILDARS